MKKFIVPKTEKKLLQTHPITSNIEGWFIRIVETSSCAFLVEAIDRYGRFISKRGSDPISLQKEVEDELCDQTASR